MNSAICKQKAIICLAAGRSQLIVIHKAKELGFAVIAVDQDAEAPGFALSDEQIVASTYEAAPILTKLAAFAGRYDIRGVVNRSAGPPVVTAALLAQALGLPGVRPEVARSVVDKGLLKAICRKGNLAVPLDQKLSSGADDADDSNIIWPCVVRPALSLVGKSGVQVVQERHMLAAAIKRAREASLNGRINIEQFIPGYNVSLHGFVDRGELQPLVLVDELNGFDNNGCIRGMGMAVPSRFDGTEDRRRIIASAQAIVALLDLGTTFCCISFRCQPKGAPTLIEIHLDLGGDLILDELMPESTNFDFLAYCIRGLAGYRQTPPLLQPRPVAVLFDEGEGLIRERSFRLLHGPDRQELERKVISHQENIYA